MNIKVDFHHEDYNESRSYPYLAVWDNDKSIVLWVAPNDGIIIRSASRRTLGSRWSYGEQEFSRPLNGSVTIYQDA